MHRARSVLAALLIVIASTPLMAQEEEAWHGGMSEDKTRASLYYGSAENGEILSISMDCSIQSGVVNVFLPESDEKYRPGYPACMTLKAGKASSTVCGATSPNELAGIPSLEAVTGIHDPVFKAMTGAASLSIQVGSGKPYEISLKGAGGKIRTFIKACSPS